MALFFSLSAYLFGEIWRKGGRHPFAIGEFAKKRFLRIFLPLWLSLLIAFPIDRYVSGNINIAGMVANVVGLNWLLPLQTSGHLWYITMLLVLYVCFVVFSRLKIDRWSFNPFLLAVLIVAGLMVFFEPLFDSVSRALPLITICMSAMMFYKGKELCVWANEHKAVSVIASIVLLVGSYLLFLFGWWDDHKAITIIAYTTAGFVLFVTMVGCLVIDGIGPVAGHVADISYEIYLVHLPIIELLLLLLSNKILLLIVWLVLTYVTALLLNRISKTIICKNNRLQR